MRVFFGTAAFSMMLSAATTFAQEPSRGAPGATAGHGDA